MRMRGTLRTGVAAASIIMAAAPPGFAPAFAEAPIKPGSPLDIRVAQAEQFSRLEFHWAGGARVTSHRDGQVLTLRFSRDARPDMAILRQTPPKWLKSAQASHDGGVLTLTLTLNDDADFKLGDADGAEYLNLFEKTAPPPTATSATAAASSTPGAPGAPAGADSSAPPVQVSQLPSPNRPNPVPVSGVVPMTATATGAQVRFDFAWARPLGAAVFRRADAIWIVFDAQARIDLSQVQRGLPQYADVQAVQGPGWSGVRITTRAPIAFVADNQGSNWSVTLAPYDPTPTAPVNLTQADDDGPVGLKANMSGATGVFWIEDPGAGDRIAVVTALGPAKGVSAEHDLVQMNVLASAQGMAVVPNADDVSVAFDGDFVKLGRPHGLTLSPASAARRAQTYAMDAPAPAAMPGLIDEDWGKTGPGGFLARYDALMDPVADENAKGQVGPVQAHLGLARFLIGSQLSYEAIGVLNDAIRQHQYLGSDAEFRALRGMARVMAGRYAEAQNDLGVPSLADNAAAANWRGYVAAKQSRWADAKREFAAGASAINQFSPYWKTRFGQAGAQTSIALGDNGAASAWIDFALANTASVHDQLDARVLQARLFEAEGYTDKALGMFRALATAASDDIAGPAQLHVTKIQYDRGAITPSKAAEAYNQLRYRWRGGAFELETIRTLGQLYLAQGRYREALEALRSAGQRLPDSPEAAQLQADLDAAFRSLFLDGQADGLQPIQALALFYDFKELTPLGSDGDLMVRKLTRRLVDVDLLPQAEDLLKYQVDNRLDGVPKAQVATDLATLYLMDKQPEQALDAINATRSTVLPQALNLQRRIIAARALSGLGRYDDATEMLGTDPSADANEVRAEVAWRQKSWADAGGLFEKMLGDRYKLGGPLTSDEEGKLLRAGVAFSLAGDDASLGRLRDRYGPYVDSTRNPDALRVALTGIAASRVSVADFGRITADNQSFSGWVAKMKDRFRNPPPPLPAAPVKQAAAAAPATKG